MGNGNYKFASNQERGRYLTKKAKEREKPWIKNSDIVNALRKRIPKTQNESEDAFFQRLRNKVSKSFAFDGEPVDFRGVTVDDALLYANIFGLPLENVLFARDSENDVVNTEVINLENLSDKEQFCIQKFGKRMTLRDFASGKEIDDETCARILEANEIFDFSIAFDEFDNQIFDYLIEYKRVNVIKKLFSKETDLHWYYKWIQRKNKLLNLALEMDDAEIFEMVVSRAWPILREIPSHTYINERQLVVGDSDIVERILNTENIFNSLISEKRLSDYDYNLTSFVSYNYSFFFPARSSYFKTINQELRDYEYLFAGYKILLDYAAETNHPKLNKIISVGIKANENICKFIEEHELNVSNFSYNTDFGGMFTEYVPWPFVIAIFNEKLHGLNIDKNLVNNFKCSFEKLTKGMKKS